MFIVLDADTHAHAQSAARPGAVAQDISSREFGVSSLTTVGLFTLNVRKPECSTTLFQYETNVEMSSEESGSGDELPYRTLICLLPNVSRKHATAEYWDTHAPSVAAFMSIFFVVALYLNSFILYSMVRSRSKLLRAPTHIVLFSLAVNDLLLTVLVMPVSIITTIAQDYPFGPSDHVRCKVCQHGLIFSILSVSSIHHIALLSLDRFLFIYTPISYKTLVTRWKMLFALLGVWFISIVIGIMPLFGFGAIGYSSSIGTCVAIFHGETHLTKNINFVLLFFVEALIPISVIVVCNIGLLCTARKHLKKLRAAKKQMYTASSTTDTNTSKKVETEMNREHKQQQFQLFKVFTAIFIGNLITWMPVLGLALASQVIDFDDVTSEAIAFVYMTYISYALIHPILESWFIVDIRSRVKKIFCCICNSRRFQEHFPSAKVGKDTCANCGYWVLSVLQCVGKRTRLGWSSSQHGDHSISMASATTDIANSTV